MWAGVSHAALPVVNGTNYQSLTPPVFNATGVSFPNPYQCMSGQMANAVGSVARAVTGGGGGIPSFTGGQCGPAGSVKRDFGSCSQISGKRSKDLLNAMLEGNNATVASYQCQKDSLNAALTELTCLSQMAAQISQQVGTLQAQFVQNLQRGQQGVGALKAIEADRQAQLEDTITKLGGDKASGAPGLIQLQAEIQKGLDVLPTQVSQMTAQVDMLEKREQAYTESIGVRRMALAKQCFVAKSDTRFKCTKKDKPTSAYEYILCRFEQNAQLTKDGRVIRKGAVAKEDAQVARDKLASLLQQMLAELPDKAEPEGGNDPSKADAAYANFVSQGRGKSVDDVLARYASKLKDIDADSSRINVGSFIKSTLKACDSSATNQVNRELGKATSMFGFAKTAIQQMKTAIQGQMEQVFGTLNNVYTAAMKGLTGQHLPLNLSSCRSAKPRVQLSCLEDIKHNLQDLMVGSDPKTKVVMQIRGTQSNVPAFTCQGINGCITALQNLSQNLRREVGKVQAFKTNFVNQVNQGVEAFAQQMAKAFSIQSQALGDYQKRINQMLSSLGVKSLLNFEAVEHEAFEKDEDGLYKIPKSIVNVVGSRMTPPLLDINKDAFGSALEGVGDRIKDIDDKLAEVQSANSELEASFAACVEEKSKDVADAEDKVQELIDQATEACSRDENFCSNDSALSSLRDTLERVSEKSGYELVSILDGCNSASQANADRDAALERLDRKIASATTSKGSIESKLQTARKRAADKRQEVETRCNSKTLDTERVACLNDPALNRLDNEVANLEKELDTREGDLERLDDQRAESSRKRTGETKGNCRALAGRASSKAQQVARKRTAVEGAGSAD